MATGTSTAFYNSINSLLHIGKGKNSKPHTDDEAKGSFRAAAGTAGKQVLDGGAGLETQGGAVLPPDDRAPLGIHETLLEDMVENVLKVEEMRGIADVEKLGSNLLLSAGSLVVGDPELSSLNLGAES